VARATVESVLENATMRFSPPLFWFVWQNPRVVLYAEQHAGCDVGYRNERYNEFAGRRHASIECVELPSGALTALSYTLLGNAGSAWKCCATGSSVGQPECRAGDGGGCGRAASDAGGAAIYHGKLEQRPALGCGKAAERADIARAVRLVQHTLCLWLLQSSGCAADCGVQIWLLNTAAACARRRSTTASRKELA